MEGQIAQHEVLAVSTINEVRIPAMEVLLGHQTQNRRARTSSAECQVPQPTQLDGRHHARLGRAREVVHARPKLDLDTRHVERDDARQKLFERGP